ncbi:MAG: TadE/TadG family type IV pilus assembly protein [Sphingomonas sp.]
MQLRALIERVRGLGADRSGVALIEFALTVPVILLLGLGGVELGNFMMANLRISQIAMSVADNAGRVRTTIDEADISEVMMGARKMGDAISLASNGRIILSDLEQRTTTTGTGGKGAVTTTNPNGYRQWIRWQRCSGDLSAISSYGVPINSSGTAVTNIDSTTNADHGAVESASTIDGMGPTGNQIAASTGTAVMMVEIVYNYQPVVPVNFLGPLTIRRVAAFNVRQRTAYSLRNDGNLTGNARADCRLFDPAVPG